MRPSDGKYECALCRAALDIPIDSEPVVMIRAASGQPNLRTIVYEGDQIHACPIPSLVPSGR